jgi:hypothetical protein
VDEPSGARLFARYAYAPNDLGYCGPADSAALFELAATGHSSADITAVASRFSGTWPYLTVLAGLAGIADPLDERVVRAYWTGGPLLDVIGREAFGERLLERIKAAGAGRYWAHLTPALLAEAAPTHAFHVFGVYPWSRLLTGPMWEQPLHVLDSCRIRWGEVVSADGASAAVATRRLTWDGSQLALGPERVETVRLDARGFVPDVQPGDCLSLHWDWACDKLHSAELSYLRRWTDWQLDMTNTRLGTPGGTMANCSPGD